MMEMQRCIQALTQIIVHQQNNINMANPVTRQRNNIEKETRYLPTFTGEEGTLHGFIASVDQIMLEYGADADQVFSVIFNTKIQGQARTVLNINTPTTWEQCKEKLKHHYRPRTDQMGLTRKINNLKVSSIRDLDIKVRYIVEEITDFAVFENNENLVNILSGLLIQRVKELASGSMAVSLMPLTTLPAVRDEIAKYIGLNIGNLNTKLLIRKYFDNNGQNNSNDQNVDNNQVNANNNNKNNNVQKSQNTRRQYTNNQQPNQNNTYNQQQNKNNNYNQQQNQRPNYNQQNKNQSQNTRQNNNAQQQNSQEAMEVDHLAEEDNKSTVEIPEDFFTQ